MSLTPVFQSQKESEFRRSQEEVIRLNRQIRDLSQVLHLGGGGSWSRLLSVCVCHTNSRSMFFQENEQLRSSLIQAHTDISVLQAELDKLKNLYIDQKELHER